METEDRYERLECIGRGSYGNVFKGVDVQTGQEVALKVIDLEDVEDDIEDIHKEITALAACNSNNITKYYASVLRPGTTELMIVMELMACSVADLLHLGPLDEAAIAYVLRGVLQALDYLHGENRIHRDIKAANVLLARSGAVKISDFGVSGQLSGTMGFRRRTFVGTPYWMAPEVIESSEEGYTTTADIWSVGITAIEMAKGSPPLADLHPMRVLFIIPKSPPPELGEGFSDTFRHFVATCLAKDPGQRPTARDLLSHPFLAAASEPPGFAGMVTEYARRKKPLPPTSASGDDQYGTQGAGSGPAWDFGTRRASRGTVAAGSTGTVKIGDTLKAGMVDRYAQNNTGTVRSSDPRFAAAAAAADAGAGSSSPSYRDRHGVAAAGNGTLRAGAGPLHRQQPSRDSDNAYGTVRVALQPQQQSFGSTLPTTHDTLRTSAAGEQAGGTLRSSGHDPYSTVRIMGGSDSYGTLPSASRMSRGGGAGGGGVPAAQTKLAATRLASLKQLQVDVPSQSMSSGGQEAILVNRVMRSESSSAQSSALFRGVMVPALKNLAAQEPGSADAVQDLSDQLSAMEKQLPGSCYRLVYELLLQLGINDSAAVAGLREEGARLLGSGLSGAQQAQGGRRGLELGPLGDFLVARWKEEVVRQQTGPRR